MYKRTDYYYLFVVLLHNLFVLHIGQLWLKSNHPPRMDRVNEPARECYIRGNRFY